MRTTENLAEILTLEPIEVNLFRGVSPNDGFPRIFGGLVIAQVRFPPILDIDSGGELVASFQERIREAYPVMQQVLEAGIAITSAPGEATLVPQPVTGVLWRFTGTDHPWQVSLARNFVALQTERYTDRADLVTRLGRVLDAVAASIKPRVCDRVGVRYSSALADENLLSRLPDLVRPEVLGATRAATGDDQVRRLHAVTDSMYTLPDGLLRGRWGVIPPGTTIDASMPPAAVDSFFIDIDVFSTGPMDFEPELVLGRVRDFCNRQYRFFRWIVTAEYLAAHGARL